MLQQLFQLQEPIQHAWWRWKEPVLQVFIGFCLKAERTEYQLTNINIFWSSVVFWTLHFFIKRQSVKFSLFMYSYMYSFHNEIHAPHALQCSHVLQHIPIEHGWYLRRLTTNIFTNFTNFSVLFLLLYKCVYNVITWAYSFITFVCGSRLLDQFWYRLRTSYRNLHGGVLLFWLWYLRLVPYHQPVSVAGEGSTGGVYICQTWQLPSV